MKVIAFYLPQFHEIKENNKWWGKGFTEWTNLKKAQPLFDGHYQPRVPLHENYYDLSDVRVMEWQCKIAREHGVYGFCMYHYWFDGHMLLEKPMEQYLEDKECDLPFCICWANENWTKAWESHENTVLIEQNYGNEKQWEEHFSNLLKFMKDDRYIKENNKPLIVIYRPQLIECLHEMLQYWNNLAVENGFAGLIFAFQHLSYSEADQKDKNSLFTYAIEYQPGYGSRDAQNKVFTALQAIKQKVGLFTEKHFNVSLELGKLKKGSDSPTLIDYDKVWKSILTRVPPTEKYVPGAFTDWDNSPRRGNRGTVYSGASVKKFKGYFKELIVRARSVYKKDMIFIFAWNEWTEGGYLEPDERNGYGFLNGIREALVETNEMPEGYGE